MLRRASADRDYRAIPELDTYDRDALDDNADMSELSMSERLAAEREMKKRDREEQVATGRIRPGLLYGTLPAPAHGRGPGSRNFS